MRRVSPLLALILAMGGVIGFWMGTRSQQAVAQQAAEDLRCPIEQVVVSRPDPKSSYTNVEACGRSCVYHTSLSGEVSQHRCD